ncbi:PREDICTED: uncharacterized protein LOC109481771 [Branchiostoma belcheri]|uniref:Uncharacterized protein LOC109481771 n=1 Tax=Branchiostoma belcheri TaxID=7741 RepID=A0A6P5ADS1_BRABE|nr:PREDICTED: uncharacterized protein LOC109481771 [Branchiostoma belcheri]
MATGSAKTIDDSSLQKIKGDVQSAYQQMLLVTPADVDVDKRKEKCWDFYDRLKPSHPRPDFKINFLTGKTNPTTLEDELRLRLVEEARREVSQNAIKIIKKFVWTIKTEPKLMTGQKSAMEVLEKLKAPQYMKLRLIELSLARQIRWETDDEDPDSGGDITAFSGTVTYDHRKLLEADRLWRRLNSTDDKSKIVPTTRALLPMMYWKRKSTLLGDETWTQWNPFQPKSSKLKKNNPPDWALDYINTKEDLPKVMQPFHHNSKPFKYPNAVYLLLCRFNGEGVPDEARVQAYAGKATNGIEDRWLQHAGASIHLIESYRKLKTFNKEPLRGSLLVDVLVARLFAEGGREYITQTADDITTHDKTHDNIALFVVCTKTEKLKETESGLISSLNLKDMKRGMNGHL